MKVMVGLARKEITYSAGVCYQAKAPYNLSWKPALSRYNRLKTKLRKRGRTRRTVILTGRGRRQFGGLC